MFCTEPCYNQLFSNQCKVYDCRKQTTGQEHEVGENEQLPSEEGADNRCLSCERLLGVRNTSSPFSLEKLPGYAAAKQRQQKQSQLVESFKSGGTYPGQTHLGPSSTENNIGEQCVRCMKPVYAAELCYSMNFPWHLQVSIFR